MCLFKCLTIFSSLSLSLQTALHWAAKHGNEDVVKLIAGTHNANVNVRTVSKKLIRLNIGMKLLQK